MPSGNFTGVGVVRWVAFWPPNLRHLYQVGLFRLSGGPTLL